MSYTIAHLFADYGVEAEALSTLGDVFRFTIEPQTNQFDTEVFQIDLMESAPSGRFNLVFCHPKCTRWSDMPNVNPEDHENQIDRAREIARSIGDAYVIENKPRAPLHDPVRLNGRMFGLPIDYERAFESNFPIEQPTYNQPINSKTVTPYYYSDRTTEWWSSVKGVRGDYPKQHIAKNALPSAYTEYIGRQWLESLETRDAEVPQDNNSRAPRKMPDNQRTLVEAGNAGKEDS